ncbi:MAG: hypothetical protein ACAH83_18055 [Alphaproteobacteria bacterium]
MSGSGTKFLASTLLTLNLLPGSLGAEPLTVSAASVPNTRQATSASRFGSVAQYGNAQEGPPAQDAQKPRDVDSELEMAERRKKVNEALITMAQEDFARVSRLAEDSYSRDLRERETRLTRYLGRNNPAVPSAVYLDPNKFDTGIALGLSARVTTERMLGLQRITVKDEILTNLADSMQSSNGSKFAAQNSFTQNPSAHFDDHLASPQACVIVPTSSTAPKFQIPGLSLQENIDFINGHESWHCKNTKYSLAAIPQTELDAIKEAEDVIGHPQRLLAVTIATKNESLSDVGALGDMIRKGHGMDIIDKVQAQRYKGSDDYLHWTASALDGLKEKINEMGIDKFRRLNDADARKLYEDVVDKNTYTPTQAEIILAYRVGNDENRAALRDWKVNYSVLENLMTAGAAVHDGADMKTLDDAIAKAPDDKTKTALSTLRDQINEIGLERFRNLSEEDAEKVAKALKDSDAVPVDIGENAAAFWRATAEERATGLAEAAKYKEAMPGAFAIMKPYGEPPTDAEKAALKNTPPTPPAPLTPAEQQVFTDLAKWDAEQMLLDRSFQKEGKITPETLIHAYAKMQEELRKELKDHPEDPLLRAKVTKLQQSFITAVKDTDYVAENADRGVNIFEKEPKLAEYLKRQQAAETPPQAPEAAPETQTPPVETQQQQAPRSFRRTPAPGPGV